MRCPQVLHCSGLCSAPPHHTLTALSPAQLILGLWRAGTIGDMKPAFSIESFALRRLAVFLECHFALLLFSALSSPSAGGFPGQSG